MLLHAKVVLCLHSLVPLHSSKTRRLLAWILMQTRQQVLRIIGRLASSFASDLTPLINHLLTLVKFSVANVPIFAFSTLSFSPYFSEVLHRLASRKSRKAAEASTYRARALLSSYCSW